MQKFILRISTAILLATITSVGVQDQGRPAPEAQPSVLSAQIEQIVPEEPRKEATSSPELKLEPTAIEAPKPISQATPIPEEQLIGEEQKQNDKQVKVLRLQKFLKSHNSPMTDNSQDFIDASEQYNLDWKLVPAIAGVESTFGKNLIEGSYNAYGWGGGRIRFDSWRDGIYTIAKGLAEKYIARGLITPFQIQPVYAPPSHTWGGKVTYFMSKIEQTVLEEDATPIEDK